MKHHETVGGHIVASVLHARPGERAGAVLARLAFEKPSSVELVLGVDEHGRFVGAAPLARVIALDSSEPVDSALDRGFPRARPNTDQEHAASLALHHGVDALPVVDAEGCALGVMPSQALLHVLRREHVEDLHVLAGIQRETSKARHAIEDPPLRSVRHRLPWLLAGLAGSAVATATMAGFESTFSRQIAVAFFVPGIVYLADAIGTRSEAIAVRGLSLTRAGIAHLLGAELRTGMLIGASLGVLAFLPVLAAFGSGPLATVIQDVLSLLVYFSVVRGFGP